tara:strand:+ start:22058 stop:23023 length:966 start_codon:yes stop_codon:yes gene_type:complete
MFSQDIYELEKKLKFLDSESYVDSSNWEKGTIINIGFNRVGLYNWSGGGQNSMSINSLINSYLNYKKNKIKWNNQLSIAFGVLKTGYGNSVPWLKNDDRIELTSKYGRKTELKWDYSVLFNFRTQFTYGYNSAEELRQGAYFSSFLAPAFPLLAVGLNYSENKDLSFFLSPATFKSTIVMDDSLSSSGQFGLNPGEKIRIEAGGYINFSYMKKNVIAIKDLDFKTNLTIFSNYINEPQNIDVTWETLTSFKLKKLFSLTFSTYLIYDHDIELARYSKDGSPEFLKNSQGEPYLDDDNNPIQKKGPITQFKEVFSLGLMFSF